MVKKINAVVAKFFIVKQIIFFFIVHIIASFFKVNFIIGSKQAFFSASAVVTPVMGASAGMGVTLFLYFILSLFFGHTLLFSLFSHLPGLFGAWYWASSSFVIRCVVPASCIALFLIHPVGFSAYAYTFFWFIPLALYVSSTRHIVAQAFGSTLVTHAVGSVIWLYTRPMTAQQWWALIPVVFVERCLFAGGALLLYGGYSLYIRTIDSIQENGGVKKWLLCDKRFKNNVGAA